MAIMSIVGRSLKGSCPGCLPVPEQTTAPPFNIYESLSSMPSLFTILLIRRTVMLTPFLLVTITTDKGRLMEVCKEVPFRKHFTEDVHVATLLISYPE